MFHLEKPQNFNSKSAGSICFLECKGEFLLLKRSLQSVQGGTWTAAPGGKLEPGETNLQAVMREVREETGICLQANAFRFLHTVYFQFPDIEYDLHLFHTIVLNRPEVVLMPTEHTEYTWASLDQALTLPLMRGGQECIGLVKTLI